MPNYNHITEIPNLGILCNAAVAIGYEFVKVHRSNVYLKKAADEKMDDVLRSQFEAGKYKVIFV